MEDGVNVENNSVIKMGASDNPNAARLANLQERKKTIEESLAKCTQELRQLCIQEADLTGTIPLEMPLEPGESPPLVRRRVGTAYQLPENLIKNSNNKDETITDLELQIQLHANMAEAALGLANEQNISKTLRRKHMTEYQQHKMQYSSLQDKLTNMKDKVHQQEHLHKQKKKPRPTEQDDNVSTTTTIEPFVKSELRHSIRSNKCIVTDNDVEQRYSTGYQRTTYKNPNIYPDGSYSRPDDSLATGLYRLSINGYKNYMERRENITNANMSSTYNPQLNSTHYNQHPHIQINPQYQQNLQQNQILQQHIHHQRTSHNSLQPMYNYNINNPYYNTLQQDYNKFNTIKNQQQQQQLSPPTNQINHRQSSPNIGTSTIQKMNYYSINQPNYSRYTNEQNCRTQNPHQIQPHQQYEHNTLGLGGYWKGSENGELVWCHTLDSNWQRDKRFGSLDRRKNKRIQKRISPNIDNKSATLASVPNYTDHVRTASIKSPQIINRRSQDNRQLVRTQSLGSVGAQTVDSVWPSDDNSSCESDNRSINDINQPNRKQKQKGWLETSLDAPVSPSHSIVSRSQSAIPSVLSPEEKYIPSSPQPHIPLPPPPHHHHHHHHHHHQHHQQHHVVPSPPPPPLPLTPKPPLEIPAESNPSPKIQETNIEMFNNNIPKNCTIVQAGHCKPYHEETKPFEMSDFYKYSTKFKKSPQKQQENINTSPKKSIMSPGGNFQKNLNESFEDMAQKTLKNFNINQNLSPVRVDNTSLNSSFDISQITNANVAEHFSDEMNAWYKSQKFHDNNDGASKSKSTATLV